MTALVVASNTRHLTAHELRDVETFRVDHAYYMAQALEERHRVFELVVELGMEAWADGEDIVFTRPNFPPTNKRAHAQRHEWLLGVPPAKGRYAGSTWVSR